MRFLFRLVVLALAAVGAKSLYEKLAPKQDQFRSSADTFLGRTQAAARDVTSKVADAAQNLASTAQTNAAEVKDAALQGADQVKDAAARRRGRRTACDELTQDDPTDADSAVGAPASH